MKRILSFGLIFIVIGFFLGGCGGAPTIQNIDNSKYFEKSVKKSEIAKAIQRGAARKGWRVKTVKDGLIEASILVRGKYFVAVNINYDSHGYKITYKKSRNLKYDPKTKTIHKSYNKWVKILSQNIDFELENIGYDNVGTVEPMKTTKATKKKVATSSTVAYKKGKAINLKGKTIYIRPTAPFAPNSRVRANIKQECTLPEAIASDIAKYASAQGLKVVIKNSIKPNEFELKVQIDQAVSAGNAAIGHNKFVVISGAIVKGKTKYYSFDAARLSGGGYWGAYRSSCSVLGGISRRLGKDVASWLLEPYDGAELGDVHLIRK